MGYTTEFTGRFELDKQLTDAHRKYLQTFSDTRRMKRDARKLAKVKDVIRVAVELPIGVDGGYFVGSGEDFGQARTLDILDYNSPPSGQPGLWCQWVPSGDGRGIEWNEAEKFYNYIEWITYLIDNFIAPWGYQVSGDVYWTGEDSDDVGRIRVVANKVDSSKGEVTYGDGGDDAIPVTADNLQFAKRLAVEFPWLADDSISMGAQSVIVMQLIRLYGNLIGVTR